MEQQRNAEMTRTTVGDVSNGEAWCFMDAVRVESDRHVPGASDERKRRVKMAAHPVCVWRHCRTPPPALLVRLLVTTWVTWPYSQSTSGTLMHEGHRGPAWAVISVVGPTKNNYICNLGRHTSNVSLDGGLSTCTVPVPDPYLLVLVVSGIPAGTGRFAHLYFGPLGLLAADHREVFLWI